MTDATVSRLLAALEALERPPSDEALTAAMQTLGGAMNRDIGTLTMHEIRVMLGAAYAVDRLGAVDRGAPSAPTASEVTRVEVIDHRRGAPSVGRVFSAWNARVELSYQDGGRTLKVFVDGDAVPSAPTDADTVTIHRGGSTPEHEGNP